jgi:hypothetical protein
MGPLAVQPRVGQADVSPRGSSHRRHESMVVGTVGSNGSNGSVRPTQPVADTARTQIPTGRHVNMRPQSRGEIHRILVCGSIVSLIWKQAQMLEEQRLDPALFAPPFPLVPRSIAVPGV